MKNDDEFLNEEDLKAINDNILKCDDERKKQYYENLDNDFVDFMLGKQKQEFVNKVPYFGI
jgi:hypothetical protein